MPSARGNALAQLLGGNWDERSDLGRIVGYLAKTLSDLLGQVTQLNFTDAGDPSVVILGPYLARGIPEVGFAILLARPDPFRVLVLRQVQQPPDYEIDIRNTCALQWKGDFLAEEKVESLWKASRKPRAMTRALLGDYHDHVFWRPGLLSFLDRLPDERGGQWLSTLRLISPDTFTAQMRSRAERAYTACSKGVHHEFVIPQSAYFDSQQMRALLTEVLEISATLGLVFNSGHHVPFCHGREEALTQFEGIQALTQEING